MISDRMRPNFAVLLALAWAIVAAGLLAQFWTQAATTIADPDDAMRLVQVRQFLAGKSWFDLAEPRLDPPYGYLTHWSRLVDAGLAGVFLTARLFVDVATSERVMIEVWPVLWLLPAMGGVAAIAWRCGSRDAAIIALVLAVFGLPAFQHFLPGRIDHHNVQIALAILTIAAAAWSDRAVWASTAAGLLSALALAVGLESLPWIVMAGTAMVLRFIFDGQAAVALRNYALALAIGTLVAFFATVSSPHWFTNVCDALAFNSALPVAIGGIALAIASKIAARGSLAMRAGAALLCAGAALGIFLALESRCIGGPFALIDPVVRPIWLAEVREMEPLAGLFAASPVMGVWMAAFPAFAILAALWLLRGVARKDFGTLLGVAALIIACVLTLTMVKAYAYAMWFAMPVVAAAVSVTFSRFEIRRPLRWMSASIFTPIAISAVATSFAEAAHPAPPQVITRPEACNRIDSYDVLKNLKPGLIAADIDIGPMLLAFTPHSILAAPYHRISRGIVTANRAFASPSGDARKVLDEVRADYLVLCGTARPTVLDRDALANGLWSRLVANDVPPWLERVPMPSGNPFVVYRVKR